MILVLGIMGMLIGELVTHQIFGEWVYTLWGVPSLVGRLAGGFLMLWICVARNRRP